MKLSSCYLEHLDSLGLRHANRLKSWVGGSGFKGVKEPSPEATTHLHLGLRLRICDPVLNTCVSVQDTKCLVQITSSS
jgi:hypothetical protein